MINPKVSIIIPVYKVEKYIRRCIDSVIAQTYQDWELILVDDGSPDRSGAICDEYAAKDSRISVYHKENGGVSSARNLGLDKAKGEWISFVDSDDTIQPDYLESYVSSIKDGSKLVMGRIEVPRIANTHLPTIIVEKKDMIDFIIKHNLLLYSAPFCKLFNNKIIHDNLLLFPLGIKNGEDGIFFTCYLNSIDKLNTIDYCGYKYNELPMSLSHNYYDFKDEWRCFEIWESEIRRLVNSSCSNSSTVDIDKLVWNLRIGSTFSRCIKSLSSQSNHCLTIKQIITYLNNIPQFHWDNYIKYYKPASKYEALQKFLLKRKMFHSFALLSNFICKTRCKIVKINMLHRGAVVNIIFYLIYTMLAKHLPQTKNSYKGLFERFRTFCVRGYITKCGKYVNIQPKATIARRVVIGDYSGIGYRCLIQGNVFLGNHVMMGPEVYIYTQNHNFSRTDVTMDAQGFQKEKPVNVGDDVWIGSRVTILPGVSIGTGSIIGASAVVSKDVPPYSTVVGNPAKIIKNRKKAQ